MRKIQWIWITLAAVCCIGCVSLQKEISDAFPAETSSIQSDTEESSVVQEAPKSKTAADNTHSEISDIDYIGNTNTKKFHYDWCSSIGQMKESNKYYYTGTREEMIEQGFEPCGKCHP